MEAELIDVDLLQGKQKQPDFLRKNIFGQVPLLEEDGDITIADSNAILVYLASQYDYEHSWLPIEPVKAAEVQRFLAVASGQVSFGPAIARVINVFGRKSDKDQAVEIAYKLLSTLDRHLQHRDWLAAEHPHPAEPGGIATGLRADTALRRRTARRGKNLKSSRSFLRQLKEEPVPLV